MTTLAKRLTVSSFFVTFALLTIFAAPQWVFILVIESFCLIGFYEFLALTDKKGIEIHKPLAMAIGALIPLVMPWGAEPLLFVLSVLLTFGIYSREDLNGKAFNSAAMR